MMNNKIENIIHSLKASREYQGQLIESPYGFSPIDNPLSIEGQKISDTASEKIFSLFCQREKISELYSIQTKIIEKILSGGNSYILSTNNYLIHWAIDISLILYSYYFGKKIVYITTNPKFTIERIRKDGDNSFEFQQLNITQKVEDTDILVITPTSFFSLINSDYNEKYSISLLYETIIIDNIHLYNNRELAHLVEIVDKIRVARIIYGLDPKELKIILTSSPLMNRKEIAGLFFKDSNDDLDILFDDDTKNNKFKLFYWKPVLQTESKIETVDKITFRKDTIDKEIIKVLKSIKMCGEEVKVLLWINELALSSDFNLHLKKIIESDASESKFEMKFTNRLEFLDSSEFFKFDIVVIVNPSKIVGYLLEQCSKLVNGNDSLVLLFIGEDHLSNQILRSKKFSLESSNEGFDLPYYFTFKSKEIQKFYDNMLDNIKTQFSELFMENINI